MKTCTHCGGQIEKDDAKFCNLCGEKFEEAQHKTCEKCGNQAELNAKFCNQCGSVFTVKDTQRKGFAIAGLIMPIFIFITYLANAELYLDTVTSGYADVVGVLLLILCVLGFIFSILGVKTCYGGIKVVAVIGLVLNCIVTLVAMMWVSSAGACFSCLSSQPSSPYNYYY